MSYSPYVVMFFFSLGASAPLPLGSAAVFVAYLALGDIHQTWLFVAALTGNILGGIVNYYCGLFVDSYAKGKYIEKAKELFTRFGGWTLIFSWVYLIGFSLTVVAGMTRYSLWKFIFFISIGKALRFLFLWASVLGFMSWIN